jgi:putative cardiolipin synthase
MRASAGAGQANVERSLAIGSSSASLHTKAAAFDRSAVFIGSLNFDPRSKLWNTEVGLYIESPELSDQLWALIQVGLRPEHSYRVELADQAGNGAGRRLVWVTEEEGESRTYTSEPAGLWRKFSAWLSGLFVPEELL